VLRVLGYNLGMNRPRSKTNPFYALVVLTGVVFAITTLVYVVALVVSESPRFDGAGTVSDSPVLRFFDQRGETLMLWEAGVLAVAAILAMGLDRWRSGKRLVGQPEGEQNNPCGPTATEN
jgi:ABC-type branched-subunit amino acid transport system permease subunit